MIVLLAAAAMAPGRTTFARQSPPSASFQGTVLRATTAEPLSGARITYIRMSTPSSAEASVTTDSAGAFAIDGIEPGTYRLRITAPGYVRHEYGQKTPHGGGVPIDLAAGQAVKNLVVRLTPGGSVEGRVRDNEGFPAVGVPVELLRFVYDPWGKRTLSTEALAVTDDHGEYRLFWLTPGLYYLRAGGERHGGPRDLDSNSETVTDGNQVFEPFSETFYPDADAVESAGTFEVRAGMEAKGVDFLVKRQRLFQIRGRVIDVQAGRFPSAADIGISGERWGIGAWPSHYRPADGTFELRGLRPGTYTVFALLSRGSPLGPKAMGSATVRIVDADIEDVVLRIVPPVSLSGRLVIEGAGPIPPELQIQLQNPAGSISSFLLPNWLSSPVNANGSFLIPQIVDGSYNVAVSEPRYYVKQAQYAGADVLSSPLKFVSGSAPSTLEVVISRNVAQVSGTITDAQLNPTPGAHVVLVPDTRRENVELFHETTTNARGHYTLENVSPGSYKLFAWEAIDYGNWFDPNVLKKHELEASPIQLRESAREVVNPRHIPVEKP
jgi:Carboxypeptidase regulatory-like domain